MATIDARLYWVWLSLACGQGSRTAVDLLCALTSPEKIYKADRAALARVLGREDAPILSRLVKKDFSDAARIVQRCDAEGIRILTPDDPTYPRSLYQLRDAPIVLYAVGTLPDFDTMCVCAVVGTRKMSEYGRRMAMEIGRGLGAGGALLVSGLALGVDGMAMAGALSVGAPTVGVLGCGIDIVYPPEHRDLMKRVLVHGAVITEYPPGTRPEGRHFPVRNRIISGLSQAVIVVEGDLKSGSLITARHALYQGRDLYAVPGSIGEAGAAGPNQLIKSGARAITSAIDVMRHYEFLYPHSLHLRAAEAELQREVSTADAADTASRLHVFDAESRKYYGDGLYGATDSQKKKSAPKKPKEKKLSPKKVVERFREEDAARPARPVVVAARVDFDELGENEKRIYNAMTPDAPILADDIQLSGMRMPEILAGLTMLELCGAVECGAGGYYMRRSADQPETSDSAD